MEDVLDVYTRPYDPQRPLVCMDESPKQLVGETRMATPARPGQVARRDYEYVRNGVANVFLFFEPLVGKRRLKVTEQRTRIEWAQGVRELVDRVHPEAEKIVLVMDQLNTHSPASLYEAFPPAEAKRIADKLEIHYTPKHGSWLNMAEIELSARIAWQSRSPDVSLADESIPREDSIGWSRRVKNTRGYMAVYPVAASTS
jgi:hypothetical protein